PQNAPQPTRHVPPDFRRPTGLPRRPLWPHPRRALCLLHFPEIRETLGTQANPQSRIPRLNPSILLIRLKSIGDILFTLPAAHAVREAFPGSKTTFLTFKQNAPLIQGFSAVDETIAVDHARYRSGNPAAILIETFTLLRRLRAARFSLAVDFQGYGETAWLAWLSRAPQRWGNVYSSGRRWAYTRGLTHNSLIHPVDWNLSLLDQCGLHPAKILNQFTLPDHALDEARRVLGALGLDPARPLLFIQPFTSFHP